VVAPPPEGGGAAVLEKLRRGNHHRITRALQGVVERPMGQFIREAHPHAVDFRPHHHGVGDVAAIMDFAARPCGHAGPVDSRPAFGQVADLAVDKVEHAIHRHLKRNGGAGLTAGLREASCVHGAMLGRTW